MEDLYALRKYGTKASYVLFVDSEKRNKAVWKTPSEYDIEFSTPFKHVYSVELLDTTIPRTEYLIDGFNNTIQFQINNEDITVVTIQPGDYDVTQFITQLNALLTANNKYIAVDGYTNPIDLQGRLRFSSNYPFSINASQSTARTVLGFSNPIIPTLNTDIGQLYDIPPAYVDGVSDDVFYSVKNTNNIVAMATFTGPAPVLNYVPITTTSWVRQAFIAQSDGNIQGITVAFKAIGSVNISNPTIQWKVVDAANAIYASGTIHVLIDQFNDYSKTTINDLDPTLVPLEYGTTYYLVLSSTLTDATTCYGVFRSQSNFPISSAPLSNNIATSADSGASWTTVFPSENLSCTINIGGYSNQIIPPGVYQLTGERYVEIHMKEIEEHIYGSRLYDTYNSCIGRVQLANFGYANAPYHFTGLSGREFSPIAKLPKLHVQFLRPDGALYDFKGVPHYYTLSIKYYTHEPSEEPPTSRLNPHYTPNATQYLVDTWTRENDARNA
jgi:hypothetical protein